MLRQMRYVEFVRRLITRLVVNLARIAVSVPPSNSQSGIICLGAISKIHPYIGYLQTALEQVDIFYILAKLKIELCIER